MQPIEKIELPNRYTVNVFVDDCADIALLGDVAGVVVSFGDSPHLHRAKKVIGEDDLPTWVKYRDDLQEQRRAGDLPGILIAAEYYRGGRGIAGLASDADNDQYRAKNIFWYCDAETIVKEWAGNLETAEKYGRGVLGEIFKFWRGEVYGYTVTAPDDREVDACWGYIGSDHKESGLVDAASGAAEYDYNTETQATAFADTFMAC